MSVPGWIPAALLASGAVKAGAELGAHVSWFPDSARLDIDALAGSGDPRATQIGPLSVDVPSTFFDEVAAMRPSAPHVVLLFDGTADAANATLAALGYAAVDAQPMMTRAIDAGVLEADAMAVEPAGAADLAGLVDLDPRSVVYTVDDAAIVNLVVREPGQIVGKVQVVFGLPGVAYLADMVVRESHRRRGIGAALVAAVEREALARGCQHVLLVSTEMGQPLYASCGYTLACWLRSFVSVTGP